MNKFFLKKAKKSFFLLLRDNNITTYKFSSLRNMSSSQIKSQPSNSTPNEETNNVTTSIPLSPPSSPVLHSSAPPATVSQSLKLIVTTSWINVLLVFVPLGYIAFGLKWSDTWVFILNFLAIVPLAKLLGFATEDISLRVGQVFIY